MKITSALSDAQKQLNITERELAELPQKIKTATESLDFDNELKLKRRRRELEERQPRQLAVVLRLQFNEAESEVERLRLELSEKKRLQLAAANYNTKAFDLYQEANRTFNLSTLDVAQAESRLTDASRTRLEIGQELNQPL